MAKINTLNYQTVASWNGSQDLFVVEQPDGTKVATPAMVKQYVLNDMDEVPVKDSNNPVKSGGIFNSEDDIWKANGMLGAKNLFNSQYSVPRTNAETTVTLGDDGHVIMNGTANADAAQFNRPGTSIKPIKDLKVGDKLILSYKVISGTFTHGSSSRNTTLYFNNKNNSAVDPIIFPLSLSAGDSDSKEIALTNECFTDGILDLKDIQIYMRSGDTFNNLELAIMLRLASDTDNTYQSYVKTNRQLTEEIGDLSQTGLTGDSVAEQLGTASGQITRKAEKNPSAFSDYTSQGLQAASQTVTINNISGGYKVIDGICYVNMQISFTGTFANPGGWGFMKGFPAPAINGVPLLAVPVTDDTNSAALLGGRMRDDGVNGGILQIINSGVITGQNSTAFTFIGSYPVA